MNELIVIPCGYRKQRAACAASDLYTGSYFRSCLAFALACVEPAQVRILSAKHGLLRLSETVEPYELKMGQEGSVTGAVVHAQANAQDLLRRRVIALGGCAYLEIVIGVWPHAATPLAGLDMLAQRSALARARRAPQPLSWLLLHGREVKRAA
jgi:hypothetical protein